MTRFRILLGHWPISVLLIVMIAGFVILANGPWWAWLLIPLGIPAQMMNEYSLHRYVFHLPPPRRQWAFNLLYQAHYGHHDFPTNHGLFFVPPWVSLPLAVLNILVVWGIAAVIGIPNPWAVAGAVVMVGGIATFISYEWFHMSAHLTVPKTWVERHVTTLHNQHHFRDFAKWFHVSPGGEVIDRAMGTAIDREALKSQQRIEFIRTLGMRPDDPRLISARNSFAGKYGLTEAEISRAAVIA